MRILYVLNGTFNYGGTESVVLNYYHNIDRSRVQIDFMLHTSKMECAQNSICNKLKKEGVSIFCVTPRRNDLIQNYKDIVCVLRENKYDVIHTHMDCIGAYILNIAKKEGITVRIAHSHNTNIPIKVNGLKSFFHRLFWEYCRYDIRRQANQYMACSVAAANWLFGRKIVKMNKVYILHNAIDVKKFRYDSEIRNTLRKKLGLDACFVIGHVGRFSYQKNHDYLIRIFQQVVRQDTSARLLLVGDGELKSEIRQQVHRAGLDSKVIFYGVSDRVNELYQVMDVFVFPSHYEGLGMTVIEAQCSGLPCVIADNSKVSTESSITPLAVRIPCTVLDVWVEEILKYKKYVRVDMHDRIGDAGYDLEKEAQKLEKYYLKIMD